MSSRSLFPSANIEASSSRKRSYAEITGSESRSQSPQPSSSKRRRIGPSASLSLDLTRNHSLSPFSYISPPEPTFERYEGDGLDYRRPVMSTLPANQTRHATIIDLTADESIEPSPQPSTIDRNMEQYDPYSRARNRHRTQEERWNDAAEPSRSRSRTRDEQTRRRNMEREATLARIQYARTHGPRFGRDIIGEDIDELEVINLVDSDATEEGEAEPALDMDEDLFGGPVDISSPEITFISERPAPGTDNIERIPSRNNLRRLPTPQNHRGSFLPSTFQNLREFVRQNTFGYRSQSDNEVDEAREALDREILDRIDGIREARPNNRNRDQARTAHGHEMRGRRMQFGDYPLPLPPRPNSIDIPDFIDVEALEMNMELDYENAAFQVGDPGRLEIIEPPHWPAMNAGRDETPIEIVKEPYVRPKSRGKGFTMNFAEDDILTCPNCQDELSVAVDGSAKEQVWMIRTCGHVYCGECAINRAVSRQKKEKAKRVERSVAPFKKCLVADCGKSVIAKNAMFQVYL